MAFLEFIQWCGAITGLFFIFALGCIVGSFINVLVYRLPRGLNVITPASRCPVCETKLRWTENFPVFGWLWLRGRCRFCKSPISPEYPIVELTVGLLFASLHVMWFMDPSILTPLGISVKALRPEWAAMGLARMWPMFAVVLTLVASLVAMTIIDAKTFTIPVVLAWITGAVALMVEPLHALWISNTFGALRGPHPWTIPVPSWPWLGASLGAGAGLAISCVLLWRGVIPRSFSDYAQWEAEATKRRGAPASNGDGRDGGTQKTEGSSIPFGPILVRTLLFTGPGIALMFVGFAVGLRMELPVQGMAIGLALGLLIGIVLRRIGPADGGESEEPMWVQYPHARREMLKELLFLAPAAALSVLGWWIGQRAGAPWVIDILTGDPTPARAAPLWLSALGGCTLGMLVGGGLVWGFRILGSLALGKEAMGMGDVHLMAAVGAVLGWIDPLLAFFIAPAFGIGAALLSTVMRSAFRRQGTALPYGPSLAAATLLVVYAKPLFERALSVLFHAEINLP